MQDYTFVFYCTRSQIVFNFERSFISLSGPEITIKWDNGRSRKIFRMQKENSYFTKWVLWLHYLKYKKPEISIFWKRVISQRGITRQYSSTYASSPKKYFFQEWILSEERKLILDSKSSGGVILLVPPLVM
mgnify:CR=1 FL=1